MGGTCYDEISSMNSDATEDSKKNCEERLILKRSTNEIV